MGDLELVESVLKINENEDFDFKTYLNQPFDLKKNSINLTEYNFESK